MSALSETDSPRMEHSSFRFIRKVEWRSKNVSDIEQLQPGLDFRILSNEGWCDGLN